MYIVHFGAQYVEDRARPSTLDYYRLLIILWILYIFEFPPVLYVW